MTVPRSFPKAKVGSLMMKVEKLRKELLNAVNGVEDEDTHALISEAEWGLIYAEKSLASALDKDEWLKGLTNEQRKRYGFKAAKE